MYIRNHVRGYDGGLWDHELDIILNSFYVGDYERDQLRYIYLMLAFHDEALNKDQFRVNRMVYVRGGKEADGSNYELIAN